MNPGTFERTFATFERAKLEIQRLNLVSSSDITVFVRAGTYYLSEPFVCNTKDNISKNNRIEFVSYPGEKPVISGGKRIAGQWKHYRDEIMMCEIEEVKKGNLDFTQLFINGKRQIHARYPAEEKLTWPHTELKYNPETFTKTLGLSQRSRWCIFLE